LYKKTDTSIGFTYLSEISFNKNEIVDFEQSSISANIGNILITSKDITQKYKLDSGQRLTHYDYSRIVRNISVDPPSKKIKIFFMRAYYDTSDIGDITSIESYKSFDYGKEILTISGVRSSDLVDFRPRVSNYTVSPNTRSPFEFYGRDFSNGNHSSPHLISGSDSIILNYSYYLPRYDSIYLDKDGVFTVVNGEPSDNPEIPEEVSGAMNIANIFLPAYLYNPSDCEIELLNYKRYQMRDIGQLEKRISNIENLTSLSLLEVDTETLFIDDGTGSNRFKSGFFTDNFTTLLTQDFSGGIRNSIDTKKKVLRPSHYTTDIKLEIGNDSMGNDVTLFSGDQKEDYRFTNIIGSGIKRTGDVANGCFNHDTSS
jgi:hypothetical protein